MKNTEVRKMNKRSDDSHMLYKVTDFFNSEGTACLMLGICHNVTTANMNGFKIYWNC